MCSCDSLYISELQIYHTVFCLKEVSCQKTCSRLLSTLHEAKASSD